MTTALVPAPDAALSWTEAVQHLAAAVAECSSVDEVKHVRDKARAVAIYFRQRGATLEVQNDAAEIRLRAERRLGQLLKDMPKNPGTLRRGPVVPEENHGEPTLGEIGITKRQSSIWQRIADLPEPTFEERLAEAKENGLELTTTHVLRPLRVPGDGQRDGAPSPDDTERTAIAKAMRPLFLLVSRWPEGQSLALLISALREYADTLERTRTGGGGHGNFREAG